MVTRGSRRGHIASGAVTVAILVLCTGLAGCGSDDPGESAEPTSAASGSTTPAPTDDDSEPGSTTPSDPSTVAPADGPWLATDYVRLRLPKGSEIEDNFGFDSIKQATLPDRGGYVHLVVYDGGDLGSLDEAARATKRDSERRLRIRADLQREDDVLLGDEAMGFHLAGAEKINTVDVVGTLRGGARFVATFFINDQFSPQRRQEILDSMLPTWEFITP